MATVNSKTSMVFYKIVAKITGLLVATNISAIELEARVLFVEYDELHLGVGAVFWPTINVSLQFFSASVNKISTSASSELSRRTIC